MPRPVCHCHCGHRWKPQGKTNLQQRLALVCLKCGMRNGVIRMPIKRGK